MKERNPFLSDSDSDEDDMPAVVPMENLFDVTAPPPPAAAAALAVLEPAGERNPFLNDSDSDDGVTAEEAAAAQRAMTARLRAETEEVRATCRSSVLVPAVRLWRAGCVASSLSSAA